MDRLLRYVRDIKQATYLDIQNVADYYFQYGEERWTYDQFSIAPPFNFFATKFTAPDDLGPEFGGFDILTPIRVVDRPRIGHAPRVISQDNQINPYRPVLVEGAQWHLEITIFGADGRRVAPPLTFFAAIGEGGQLLTYRGYNALWITDMANGPGVGIAANTNLQISMLALTFLHSKNVELVDPPPPSRKRLPRKIKFESRYHRLKVNAIGQRSEAGSGERTGITHGLHIVRGHFREYGPEFGKKKLFGRLSGRYWIAAHAAGSSDQGVITKDYEVEAPPDRGDNEK